MKFREESHYEPINERTSSLVLTVKPSQTNFDEMDTSSMNVGVENIRKNFRRPEMRHLQR